MKNRKCPNHKHCLDYECGACETCDLGNEIIKLHKRIARLKKKNETLTIQRNAWALTAKELTEKVKDAPAADVAAEIFADIEDLRIKALHGEIEISTLIVRLYMLKQKYTEDGNNG